MSKQHYIWVNVPGGVQGYTPEHHLTFEKEWADELKLYPHRYWDLFNFHFEMETGDDPGAYGYSGICSDSVAWEELYKLRRNE